MPCQLCDRAVTDLTEHHLVPRQYTRRRKLPTSATVLLCRPCHKQIHTLFDNHTLARDLNTPRPTQSRTQATKVCRLGSKAAAPKTH